jgi:hypothetical protein
VRDEGPPSRHLYGDLLVRLHLARNRYDTSSQETPPVSQPTRQ